MNFALAVAIAVNFWAAHGVKVPCTPNHIVGAAADRILPKDEWGIPAAMGAIPETCTIYVSTYAALARHEINMKPNYCMEITHEVGHLAGLPHTTNLRDVMYEGGTNDQWAPYHCRHWRKFARKHGFTRGARRGSASAPGRAIAA